MWTLAKVFAACVAFLGPALAQNCSTDLQNVEQALAGLGHDVKGISKCCPSVKCRKKKDDLCTQDVTDLTNLLGQATTALGMASKDCTGVSAQCSSAITNLGSQ